MEKANKNIYINSIFVFHKRENVLKNKDNIYEDGNDT